LAKVGPVVAKRAGRNAFMSRPVFETVLFVSRKDAPVARQSILGIQRLGRVVRRLENAEGSRVTVVGNLPGAELRTSLSGYPKRANLNVENTLTNGVQTEPGTRVVLFWDQNLIARKGFVEDLVQECRKAGHALSAADGAALAVPVDLLQTTGDWRTCSSIGDVHQLLLDGAAPVRELELEGFYCKATDRAGRRELKTHLLDELRKPMEVDGAISVLFYRPISLRITRLIANRNIRPNHATGAALILGLMAAGAMASGTPAGFVLGALLLQVGAIVDCVDGELARLKDQGSLSGAWFDTVTDDIVNNSFILATGIGLARYYDAMWPLVLGAIAVMLILPGLAYMYRDIRRMGSGDLCDFNWSFETDTASSEAGLVARLQSVLKYAVKRDVYVLFFLLVIVCGAPSLVLYTALLGALGFELSLIRELVYRNRFAREQAGQRVAAGMIRPIK